jgi:hypothetical protein
MEKAKFPAWGIRLVAPMVIILWLSPAAMRADTAANANTVEITDGPVPGHAAGVILMNAHCSYGSHYHYELTSEGELRAKGPIVCGNFNGGTGGEQVCYLGPQLACQARQGFSPAPGIAYSVDQSGVKVGDKVYPWADPQQAVALFAAIRARARSKCEEVLFWQAEDAKRKSSITPSPDRLQAQAACRPVLEEVCASARGGPARLADGKDIAVLCLR